MKKAALLSLFILVLFTALPVLAMGQPPQPPNVLELQSKIFNALNQMDIDLAQAAKQLSSLELDGEAASQILQKLYAYHPSAVDIATIDLEGNLLLIEPEKYKESEGENISNQPHFDMLKITQKPVLSEMRKTVEGFYAVSLAYPIFSQNKPIGFVSIVLKPDALMRKTIQNFISGFSSMEVLAIQKDGRIIYDKDFQQIGKMTFSDPLYQSYPALLALAKKITQQTSGTGIYDFSVKSGKEPVKKAAEWATIGLHGTEWRLVLSEVID